MTPSAGAVVAGLRGAGADVWYDEHNMGSGQLIDTIERELRARPVFVLVLSPPPCARSGCATSASGPTLRFKRDPSRIILPVLATALRDEDDIWMFLQDFKRIEAAGLKPYPTAEAVRRLLHAARAHPRWRGSRAYRRAAQRERRRPAGARQGALLAQKRYAEAIPLFERATQLDQKSFDAWANLGICAQRVEALS